MTPPWRGVRFGLGLIEIGRAWAATPSVPAESEAVAFLHQAYALGVRLFDTAPSYAFSEARLGRFLSELTSAQRAEITLATKFGEDWDFENHQPVTAHTLDFLKRSLDRSLRLLGPIDLLQVHKSTAENLASGDLQRAFDAAEQSGVNMFGASLKDIGAARVACADPRIRAVQLPFNKSNRACLDSLRLARDTGRAVLTNRPFAEGALLAAPGAVDAAIGAVLEEPFDGAILFGTSSIAHLKENLAAAQRLM